MPTARIPRAVCLPVACLGRVVSPDDWGHHTLPNAHLRPPPKPHRDQQVRTVFRLFTRPSFQPGRERCLPLT